ncbi:hmg-i/hmg-y, DNA-binding protein [Sporothrix brasiliensis 5110]|uniref:Hmg-i/hmg-y, DNA-binding protein n=1 Tax=Sporothrix brasiliensis 5110 TaxID=1398154 RepID=A0A0C2INZ1_9PEZI|nr:hmg-i/hmg-y, DNA-binding protein [Sporothrix brasiliensis 5110]KIH90761.1 hmg-i/hmg-y, DNA-binding protein [Sporothrix brasiliensis 5110]
METPIPPPTVQAPAAVKPEPIRRNGFQYDGTFSTIDGVAFERPQHLLRLCYPSEPDKWKIKLGRGRPPKMEKITDMEAARTLSRKFMLAQFRFYGIPPPYQSSSDEVMAIFREQVTAGNFRKMTPDVETLRDEMVAEWDARRDPNAQRPRGRPKGSTRKPEDLLPATIAGAYVITSKEIQDQWSVNGTLTLDVAATSTPGVYKATFHFGVVLGVMILSADEKQLTSHVRRLDAGDDPDRRAGDDLSAAGKRKQPPNGAGRHSDVQQQMASGKKARMGPGATPQHPQHPQHQQQHPQGGPGQGLAPVAGMQPMGGMPGMPGMPPPTMPGNLGGLGALVGGGGLGGMHGSPGGQHPGHQGTPVRSATAPETPSTPTTPMAVISGRPPLKFYVRWRGRGLVDNNMQTGEHRGTLKFTNKHYTKFAGEMDLAFLGADEITGKRISDVPTLSGESWSDYLETVYDWTRNRWN